VYLFCRSIPPALRGALFRGFYRENEIYREVLASLGPYAIYLDGCKSLARFELLHTRWEGMKVIHLVRDPRYCIYSSYVKRRINPSPRQLLFSWIQYNRFAHAFHERLGPSRYHLVSYEGLVRDPERTVREIFRFMGVASPPPALDAIDVSRLHVVGNPMRLGFRRIEDHSGDWRGRLDPGLAERIERRTAHLPWLRVVRAQSV